MTPEAAPRFWERVDASGDCWLWTGPTRKGGYGVYESRVAHRVAYEALVGPIPAGLTLDHLCRVRLCINPDHVEPVTNRENILRGFSPSARDARKRACVNGHPLDGTNLRLDYKDGRVRRRVCLTCRYARNVKAYLRRLERERAAA